MGVRYQKGRRREGASEREHERGDTTAVEIIYMHLHSPTIEVDREEECT